jgi:hypothetical protein
MENESDCDPEPERFHLVNGPWNGLLEFLGVFVIGFQKPIALQNPLKLVSNHWQEIYGLVGHHSESRKVENVELETLGKPDKKLRRDSVQQKSQGSETNLHA